MKLKAEGGEKDKMAVALAYPQDLSAKAAFCLDVFNPGPEPISIALAFITGDSWLYYETKLIEVPQGWARGLKVDLAAAEFKSEASGWEFKSFLNNPNQLRDIVLLIYNGKQAATALFDNLLFE